MALSNAYFGSTLTDAQRAATGAAQQGLEADALRRQFLAEIMRSRLNNQRLAQQDQQMNRELGLRDQEMQTNALLRALALANQQQQVDQNANLYRQGLANQQEIARIQYPRERWMQEGDREAAERIRQQGMFDQNLALLDDEIDQHNTSADAAAARYNALLKSLTDEKDTMFTARSTAQKEAWRQLLDGMKVGGDDKFIKPEIGVDAATKEVNYKFVPILRQKRSRTKAAASGGATADSAAIIQEAKRAIAQGADPTAVADKLWSKYNLRMPSETAAMPPGATPADMNALLNALRGGMATGGDVYPPMSNQAAMAPASVRAETMPIPGAPTAFQPNSPSLVDIIRQLQSYADR